MTGTRLILIRHAKAEAGGLDLQRRLTPRGESDAAAAGRLLAAAGVVPDRAVLSPARRARQTWDGVQAELAQPVQAVVDERVYDNEVAALFGVVADAVAEAGADAVGETAADAVAEAGAEAGAVGCLVLVGHNPSFAEFAAALDDGQGDRLARQRLLAGYPTSGVAVFDITGGWDALAPGSASLRSFEAARGPA